MDSKFSKLSYIILICIFLSIHSFSRRASFPQMREGEKVPKEEKMSQNQKVMSSILSFPSIDCTQQ